MGNYFTIGEECRSGYNYELKKNLQQSKLIRSWLFNVEGLITISRGIRKSVTYLDYVKDLSVDASSQSIQLPEETKQEKDEHILFRGVNSEVASDYYI